MAGHLDHPPGAPGHRLFVAAKLMIPSVGVYRYRAFCTCEWVSEPTQDRGELDRRIVEHLSAQ